MATKYLLDQIFKFFHTNFFFKFILIKIAVIEFELEFYTAGVVFI